MSTGSWRACSQRAADMADRDDDMLRIDGVTIGRGGSCYSGQLLMREPYRDRSVR